MQGRSDQSNEKYCLNPLANAFMILNLLTEKYCARINRHVKTACSFTGAE